MKMSFGSVRRLRDSWGGTGHVGGHQARGGAALFNQADVQALGRSVAEGVYRLAGLKRDAFDSLVAGQAENSGQSFGSYVTQEVG